MICLALNWTCKILITCTVGADTHLLCQTLQCVCVSLCDKVGTGTSWVHVTLWLTTAWQFEYMNNMNNTQFMMSLLLMWALCMHTPLWPHYALCLVCQVYVVILKLSSLASLVKPAYHEVEETQQVAPVIRRSIFQIKIRMGTIQFFTCTISHCWFSI